MNTDQYQDNTLALADLWDAWAEIGSNLKPEQWTLATRCEDWDVQALFAHVSAGVGGLLSLLNERKVDSVPDLVRATDIIRMVKPSPEVAQKLAVRVSAMAIEDARSQTPASLIERLASGREVCLLAQQHLGDVADYFGRGNATIAGSVDLRVVEAAVHLLDLQASLGMPADLPESGAAVTMEFLVGLVPAVDFIEAATGRTTAQFFPLHS
jgi:uncharacterized protein (TIGR03083 family)